MTANFTVVRTPIATMGTVKQYMHNECHRNRLKASENARKWIAVNKVDECAESDSRI